MRKAAEAQADKIFEANDHDVAFRKLKQEFVKAKGELEAAQFEVEQVGENLEETKKLQADAEEAYTKVKAERDTAAKQAKDFAKMKKQLEDEMGAHKKNQWEWDQEKADLLRKSQDAERQLQDAKRDLEGEKARQLDEAERERQRQAEQEQWMKDREREKQRDADRMKELEDETRAREAELEAQRQKEAERERERQREMEALKEKARQMDRERQDWNKERENMEADREKLKRDAQRQREEQANREKEDRQRDNERDKERQREMDALREQMDRDRADWARERDALEAELQRQREEQRDDRQKELERDRERQREIDALKGQLDREREDWAREREALEAEREKLQYDHQRDLEKDREKQREIEALKEKARHIEKMTRAKDGERMAEALARHTGSFALRRYFFKLLRYRGEKLQRRHLHKIELSLNLEDRNNRILTRRYYYKLYHNAVKCRARGSAAALLERSTFRRLTENYWLKWYTWFMRRKTIRQQVTNGAMMMRCRVLNRGLLRSAFHVWKRYIRRKQGLDLALLLMFHRNMLPLVGGYFQKLREYANASRGEKVHTARGLETKNTNVLLTMYYNKWLYFYVIVAENRKRNYQLAKQLEDKNSSRCLVRAYYRKWFFWYQVMKERGRLTHAEKEIQDFYHNWANFMVNVKQRKMDEQLQQIQGDREAEREAELEREFHLEQERARIQSAIDLRDQQLENQREAERQRLALREVERMAEAEKDDERERERAQERQRVLEMEVGGLDLQARCAELEAELRGVRDMQRRAEDDAHAMGQERSQLHEELHRVGLAAAHDREQLHDEIRRLEMILNSTKEKHTRELMNARANWSRMEEETHALQTQVDAIRHRQGPRSQTGESRIEHVHHEVKVPGLDTIQHRHSSYEVPVGSSSSMDPPDGEVLNSLQTQLESLIRNFEDIQPPPTGPVTPSRSNGPPQSQPSSYPASSRLPVGSSLSATVPPTPFFPPPSNPRSPGTTDNSTPLPPPSLGQGYPPPRSSVAPSPGGSPFPPVVGSQPPPRSPFTLPHPTDQVGRHHAAPPSTTTTTNEYFYKYSTQHPIPEARG